jgi:hypothetical protein
MSLRALPVGFVAPCPWAAVQWNGVNDRLNAESLSKEYIEKMPYTVLAIEDLEVGSQIINSVGISDFFDGKLNDAEMRTWEWHGYMTRRFPSHFPANRPFDAEYEQLFGDVA